MLPYTTIEEAEIAMNRTLTVLECVWFNYSANKPDFYLYIHNIIFLYFISLFIPFPLAFIELLGIPNIERYKLQPKVRLSIPEIISCCKTVVKTFFFAVGPLGFISYPSIKLVGIRTGLSLPSAWEILIQLMVYFMIEDYLHYWLHRLLHCKWLYENVHRVHHEYSAPIGFAAPYAHWAEILILGAPSFLATAIVPCHITTFWLWMALRNIEAIETHSGYDFPWSPTKYIPFYGGAKYHDYHHWVGRQSHSNFASVFTYCDFIYGTDKGYRYQEKLVAKMSKNSSSSELNNELKLD